MVGNPRPPPRAPPDIPTQDVGTMGGTAPFHTPGILVSRNRSISITDDNEGIHLIDTGGACGQRNREIIDWASGLEVDPFLVQPVKCPTPVDVFHEMSVNELKTVRLIPRRRDGEPL